jgi:hypothetical protein
MRAVFEKLKINQIMFEEGDNEVLVHATIDQGKSTFDTQLLLNFTDLNILLNKMQKLDVDLDLSNLFETTKMYDGHLLYTTRQDQMNLHPIQFDAMEFNHSVRQIRA